MLSAHRRRKNTFTSVSLGRNLGGVSCSGQTEVLVRERSGARPPATADGQWQPRSQLPTQVLHLPAKPPHAPAKVPQVAPPALHLPIEALVLAENRPSWEVGIYTSEYRSIFEICSDWRSVAEVAALCGFTLGATRTLVANMAGEGLLRIHHQNQARPDLALLERLLEGLKRL